MKTRLASRRRFLWLSAVMLLPLGASCARAQETAPEPAPDAIAATTDTPNAKSAQSRLGLNLNGLSDWTSELPFVDVFRLSRAWISQEEGKGWGQGPPLDLDERGDVKSLQPGTFAETPMLTINGNGDYPAGDYVCLFDGEGQIEFNGGATVKEREANRLVVTVRPKRGLFLQLRETNPANPVRNIRFLMPGTEDTYKQQPWNPVFLERVRDFNTLRFMDWMHTNGSPVKEWADRPKSTDSRYTDKGAPLETMIALSNRLNTNAWFCIPHEASDDYVRQFAAQVKRDLKPNLKAYIEYSNETWNGMFAQAKYAGDRGLQLGIAEQHWEASWHYTARRSNEIFALFDEVYGGREAASKQIVRVLASQAGNAYVAEQILKFENAGQNADALAIAPYFSMNIAPRANDPQSRIPVEEVQNWSPDDALNYLEQVAIPETEKWVRDHKTLSDRYNLRLIAYEGGQHAVGIQGAENNEAVTKLLMNINRYPRMGELYTRYLDAWRDNGGELFAVFASVGTWSKWGSWGLLENQNDDTPKYRAVVAWNEANAQAQPATQN